LLIAGTQYFTVNGPLSTVRETEPTPSRRVAEMVAASAKAEQVGVSS
jgi:hypothetical protein